MNDIDLRAMVADEVQYKGLPEDTVDKAINYIQNSPRLMEMLDIVALEAILAVRRTEELS